MSVPRSLEDIAQALATEIGAWLENPDPEPADSMAEICLRSLQSAVDAQRERDAGIADEVAARWSAFHSVAPAAAAEVAKAIRGGKPDDE